MINPHIVRKTYSPTSAPPEAGVHWINTTSGEEFFSVGTSTVNDWIARENIGTWLFDAGAPSSGLGNDLDNYLNTTNGDYYQKQSGAWVLLGNLTGPTGATGDTGPTGATGDPGADGSQIYTGEGLPSGGLGANSDIYFDTTASTYYQKILGVWVFKGSFGGISDHGLLSGLSDNDHPQYRLNATQLEIESVASEPTGFPNRTDSSISFSDDFRLFTIQPTGVSFSFFVKGQKFVKTTPQTIEITDVSTTHYIYFDNNGDLVSTIVLGSEIFTGNAIVSIVHWDAVSGSNVYFSDERHGLVMDGMTHAYLHTVFGARYISGLALQGFTIGNGSLDAHAKFECDAGTIRDEDLLHQSTAQVQFPVLYREGAVWKKKAPSDFALISTGVGGRIAYNLLTSSTWSLAEVPNNAFMMMHLFATNDVNTPIVAVCGINYYLTKPDAQDSANSEISSLGGLPFAEFVPIGTVIFQTSDSMTNSVKAAVVVTGDGADYVDFRGSQLFVPGGQATKHGLLSGLDADDHLQYYNQARGDARYAQISGQVFTGNISATNLSGTNTGDETTSTIKSKLGEASASTDGYVTSTYFNQFDYKYSASKCIAAMQPIWNSATPQLYGISALGVTGTATAYLPTMNSAYAHKKLIEYNATSSTNAVAGVRFLENMVMQKNLSFKGGFKFSIGFGFSSGLGAGKENRRFFAGLSSSLLAPTDVDPSTLTNMFGVGKDKGDTNISFFYNDDLGSATKVVTGLVFPNAPRYRYYILEIESLVDSVITMRLFDTITSGFIIETIQASIDIPFSTTQLSPRIWMSAGDIPTSVGVGVGHIYLEF